MALIEEKYNREGSEASEENAKELYHP